MKRIGLVSDTHNFLDEKILSHFKDCDEIWHAGDFGDIEIAEKLMSAGNQNHPAVLRGVYGNIDGNDIRSKFPEELIFDCEKVRVFIKHIGGYPKKYAPGVKNTIVKERIQLFISGHSHILKIIFDDQLQCLHINPGAAGNQGWHLVRTIVRFTIDGKDIKNCEVIELGKRGESV